MLQASEEFFNWGPFDRIPSKKGEGAWKDTLIIEQRLEALVNIMRYQVFKVLTVREKGPVKSEINVHISANSTNVRIRIQCSNQFIERLGHWLGSNIEHHAVLRVKQITETPEEVQMRVNFAFVQMFGCKHEVDGQIFTLVGSLSLYYLKTNKTLIFIIYNKFLLKCVDNILNRLLLFVGRKEHIGIKWSVILRFLTKRPLVGVRGNSAFVFLYKFLKWDDIYFLFIRRIFFSENFINFLVLEKTFLIGFLFKIVTFFFVIFANVDITISNQDYDELILEFLPRRWLTLIPYDIVVHVD